MGFNCTSLYSLGNAGEASFFRQTDKNSHARWYMHIYFPCLLPDCLQFVEASDGSLVGICEIVHLVGFAVGARRIRRRRRNHATAPLEGAGLMGSGDVAWRRRSGVTGVDRSNWTHSSHVRCHRTLLSPFPVFVCIFVCVRERENKSNRTTMRPLGVYFIEISIYILNMIHFLMISGDFGGFF